jgi:hypothetical protein
MADQRVWLGPLGTSRSFKDFVDLTVPKIIEKHNSEVATFELWIELQYEIAQAWADLSDSKQNENIARSLAGYTDKDFFLMVHNTDEKGYALQIRGLFYDEYAEMKAGEFTIGELYRQNPVAFFGPLLRKNEWATN